jgi:hypothetical protein
MKKKDQILLEQTYYKVYLNENLDINKLAAISDEALDKAYQYGRSAPGNTFGWQANLKSAEFAANAINKGVTDIEVISDEIHKGWNETAKRFVTNPDQFDDTSKLKQAGKLESKLEQRKKLMNVQYAQLPEEEKEKDRVVARALLQAIKPSNTVQENLNDSNPDIDVLLEPVTNQESKQKIIDILKKHPDWIDGLKNFQKTDPQGYKMSIVNFNSNYVSDHLVSKMAQGKSIGYYDYM